MSNVVSLAEWKKQKDEEEIERLEAELASLVGDLDITPEPYFVPIDMYIPAAATTNFGVISRVNPTVKDCTVDLQFISWVLESLGEEEASNTINKIVEKLNTKE